MIDQAMAEAIARVAADMLNEERPAGAPKLSPEDALRWPLRRAERASQLEAALTPSTENKALLMGEFECDHRPDGFAPHHVPWTSIKRIMHRIRETA